MTRMPLLLPPLCGEVRLDHQGTRRVCVLDLDHPDEHEDVRGDRWEPPSLTLERLNRTWGATHRIAWTGSLWMATHRDPRAHWRTQIEHTPDQLEERLRRYSGHPPIPPSRPSRERPPGPE
ncbi:hypothetical protein [Nocardiopsis lambiniae]|uniref:Uncharacterized protein n=1 Tax=Nocardiopsis lambiniae TaxID=3075539 RepID=A0ABU2M6C7_9ACTN|nr:hypothetical protein [Nocardiopsis sp. DSM 44743]MDT0328223.1 hypothetical protein [Nocardiopsis sp. DSM 44743]